MKIRSYHRLSLKRLASWSGVLLTIFTFGVQPTLVSADGISDADLKSLRYNMPFYGGGSLGTCATAVTTAAQSVALTGGDNIQKGFNFFVGQGLSDVQAAAIIGNFRVESGNLNPKADNGSHYGIAQWDYAAKVKNPNLPKDKDPYYAGRFGNLRKFAESKKLSPTDLGTQLQFSWNEFNGITPAGDYSDVLKQLKTYTSKDQIDQATQYVQDHYEVAVGQATQARQKAAEQTLHDYGNGDGGGGTTSPVSGADASCASGGSVTCNNGTGAGGGLSQTRQNVVCLAQAELALWSSSQMKPGTDFFKYESGGTTDESWCADFASWIYNKADYPIDQSAPNGRVSAVSAIAQVGNVGQRFSYHPVGTYTPQPGDLVIYEKGWSHVNLVISVNSNNGTMSTIGGNEGGNVQGTGTDSSVKQTDGIDYSKGQGTYGSEISGFVSPLDSATTASN